MPRLPLFYCIILHEYIHQAPAFVYLLREFFGTVRRLCFNRNSQPSAWSHSSRAFSSLCIIRVRVVWDFGHKMLVTAPAPSFPLVVKWRLQSIKTQTQSARAQTGGGGGESGVSQEPAGKVLLGNGERDPLSPPTAFCFGEHSCSAVIDRKLIWLRRAASCREVIVQRDLIRF